MNYPPVRVIPAADAPTSKLANPVDYIKDPYEIGFAVRVVSDSPITSTDADEGARRSLATNEGIDFGITEVGPGGGETWHTHLSYYDIVIYVERGSGAFWWEEDGVEHRQEIGPGDFVHISPSARNQWLNTGTETLRFVWVAHYHNFHEAAS